MRIAVVGAGGIGGFLAAMLSRAGNTVSVVARGEHLTAIRTHGLRVSSGTFGEMTVRIEAAPDLRELSQVDCILLCTKAHQTRAILNQLVEGPSASADLVTLQNGLPFWYFADRSMRAVDPDGALRQHIPDARIMGGVVHASGSVLQPGVIRHDGGFRYPLGEASGPISSRLEKLVTCFLAAGLQSTCESEIRIATWRKLFGNVALNPISALTGATVHAMLRDATIRELLIHVVSEARAVAAASGIDVAETLEARIGHIETLADVKTSMLQDLEAHRELELDPIVGATLEIARSFDVPTPRIAALYALTQLRAATHS